MNYKGDISAGQVFMDHFPVHTSAGLPTVFTDGALTILQGTAVTGGITWGATLATTDKVGIYQVQVNTASVCYPTGYDYTVVATGTTSGITGVTYPVSEFSIENRKGATDAALINALPTVVAPTVAQLNARTLTSAEYATNTDLDALAVLVNALPTTAGTLVMTSTDITNLALSVAAAVIARMGAATVTISSPVKSTGDIEIIRGVDYVTELVWSLAYSGSLTGYTAALNCVPVGITAKAVTISGSAGAYTITAAFNKAATTALLVGKSGYGIKFTKTSDSTVLPICIEGQCNVRDLLGT